MNIYTRQIAKLLSIDLEMALKVQNAMGGCGFDFSESTTRQFNTEARMMYEIISHEDAKQLMLDVSK